MTTSHSYELVYCIGLRPRKETVKAPNAVAAIQAILDANAPNKVDIVRCTKTCHNGLPTLGALLAACGCKPQ